jgi:hypothetical protein
MNQDRLPFKTLLVLFSAGVFVSAFLLFLVQPMVGKMFLPVLGGTPSVWNTCVLFFQICLLGGYAFAHLLSRKATTARQFLVFGGLLAVSLVVLPISIGNRIPPGRENPVDWLLLQLAVTVGLPFFILSTVSPLMQRWFSFTSHPARGNPYFLYVSSNTGSLAALIAYPVLFETQFALSTQSLIWTGGYVLLGALLVSCILLARRTGIDGGPGLFPETETATPPTIRTGLFWLLAAFLPSSLMLAATTAMSTNLAPVPFLWVLPLGLYLVSLVFAFMVRPPIPHGFVARFLPVAVVLVALPMSDKITYRWMGIWSHLVLVFFGSLFCHRELVLRRPAARYLTQFYLWVAAGGALGGVFNAIVAPLVFSSVVEYPLVVLLIALFCAATVLKMEMLPGEKAVFGAVQLGSLIGALYLLTSEFYGIRGSSPATWLVFGSPVAVGWLLGKTARRIGLLVLAAQVALFTRWTVQPQDLLVLQRNFFGVKKVTEGYSGRYHYLTHGDTSHGVQRLERGFRTEPLAYYFRSGPLGDIFRALESEPEFLRRVAILGLGVGTIAAYGKPGQEFDFYEIDPAMEQIAKNPLYFTYLTEAQAETRVILGDARLRLQEAPDSHYQLIVVDAFSSDAIPPHLLSLEAVQLMLQKIAPTGLLVFHISNRYLNLRPVLANSAAELNLLAHGRIKVDLLPSESVEGKYPNSYLILSREIDHLRGIDQLEDWEVLGRSPRVRVWTDDFSSLFPVLRFN